MSDFEKLINASDLIEWIIETDPDWCVGSVRSIIDHIDKMPSAQPETHDKCTKTHSCDLIDRQAAIDTFYKHPNIDWTTLDVLAKINALPSAQPEIKPIDYQDCANAMLRMWMDKVVTDGEYNRIMDKLNAFWGTRNERSDRQTSGD